MSSLSLDTIRPNYGVLTRSPVEHAEAEDLWARCSKPSDGTTQHGGEAQIVEIVAVAMLCEERLWPGQMVAPEAVRRHKDVARRKSLLGYVLTSLTLIFMDHTDADARWNAALELLQELPDLATQLGSPVADKHLAADLINAMKVPAVHA